MPTNDPEKRRAYWRKWHRNHPDASRKNRMRQRKRIGEIVAALKSKPCADCKGTFPVVCMDFDHLSDKEFNVSRGWTRGLAKVLAEVAKCEVVCSNCHRIRTHNRRGRGPR